MTIMHAIPIILKRWHSLISGKLLTKAFVPSTPSYLKLHVHYTPYIEMELGKGLTFYDTSGNRMDVLIQNIET